MKKMAFFLGFSICLSTLFAQNSNRSQALREMKQADIRFSALSQKAGMRKAFLAYLHSDGILLRADHPPIIGVDARKFLQNINDSSFHLTWQPRGADIASSLDFGFTYGIYTMKTKDKTMQGTYVSIWKKEKDGNWKFVLDTGNPGLGK